MHTRRLLIAIPFLLVGCSSSMPKAPPADHPANADAPEAPLSSSNTTLAISEPPATAPSGESMGMGGMHGGHQMQRGMPGVSHDMKGMQHQMPTARPEQTSAPATRQATAVYTCVMHPDVISDKPGKCPKCGMKLMLKKGAR